MKHPEGKYAWTVKAGEKGQPVIPKQARDVFNIKPGFSTQNEWRKSIKDTPFIKRTS